MPVNAVKFCLRQAGLNASDIDRVAFPWSVMALREKRLEYFIRTIRSKPARAYKNFSGITRNYALRLHLSGKP